MNIFIHRRDLRLFDNTTLNYMDKELGSVQPIFIFNPKQIDAKQNKYFSNNLVQFMCESLIDLSKQYKKCKKELFLFEGDVLEVLDSIHQKTPINSIGFNKDYSPFSKERDSSVKDWCESRNVKFVCLEDMLLLDIDSNNSINPNQNKPYLVFTPFMKNAKKHSVKKVDSRKLKEGKSVVKSEYLINVGEISKYYVKNKNIHIDGGRLGGLNILSGMHKFEDYDKCRNYIFYKTTSLSGYINLGLVSIREVYQTVKKKLGIDSGLITELYWRDFYYNILHFFPHVTGGSFKEIYDKIKWENDTDLFKKWTDGKTGFPMVDACMRQLNKTGYMHNRGRMIVASFLTKDLLIDWRWGEQYFATKLVDYNISANNGGWQWAAGTGTDAQPYFRIFNPWTQSENFDKNCVYIKKWIPELEKVGNKHIHQWFRYHDMYQNTYLKPIIDHAEARKKALDMYKDI